MNFKLLTNKDKELLSNFVKSNKEHLKQIEEAINNQAQKIKNLEKKIKIYEETIMLLRQTETKKEIDEIEITPLNQHVHNLIDIASGNFGNDLEEKING